MTNSSLFITLIIALLIIIVLFFKFYRKASKEVTFVRTGLGGEKVVMGGGALVVPIIQELTKVNLNTLRLRIELINEQSVISKDRMRVDIIADFYMHVKHDKESISLAASTLGSRTLNQDSMRDIVEGKFIDAIHCATAEMEMEQLHEKRKTYTSKIYNLLTNDLSRNGLALESVSITSLEQANMDYFNPSNAFDAEGLTKLIQTIEQRKKKRNDIEQDTQIEIKNKNLETEKLNLILEREAQFARLEQESEIENKKSEQTSNIAQKRAKQAQIADEADIAKQEKVKLAQILSERIIDEQKINNEHTLNEQKINKEKELLLAQQLNEQETSKASIVQMQSKIAAEKERATLVSAEEYVLTSRQKEVARRQKAVAVIEAAQKAECEAVALQLLATAKKAAAVDDAQTIQIKTKADEIKYKVEAEGVRILNDARNVLSEAHLSAEVRKYLIDNLPKIIKESSEPLKNIDSIKIVQTDGLGTKNQTTKGSNDVFDGALRYRAQAPIIDALLKDLDINSTLETKNDDDK